MAGRKHTLDAHPELIARVVRNIREGHDHKRACRAEGVNYATFENWLTDGRKENADPRLARLVADVEAADESGIVSDVRMLRSWFYDDWRAIAWYLARRDPARFGKVETVRMGGDPDGVPIRTEQEANIDFTGWPVEDVLAYADLLIRNGQAEPDDE